MIETFRIGQFSAQVNTPQRFGADIIDYSFYPEGRLVVTTTVVFKKTLSSVGTKVGSRQIHGWN